jgi:hypothetical protein
MASEFRGAFDGGGDVARVPAALTALAPPDQRAVVGYQTRTCPSTRRSLSRDDSLASPGRPPPKPNARA